MSAYCGQYNEKNEGETVILSGWSSSIRDHGGIIFIDLRDKSGIIKVVSDPKNSKKFHSVAEEVRNEYIIKIAGTIRLRSQETINSGIPTGKIEVLLNEIEILNQSIPAPFQIEENVDDDENTRMKYRY